MKRQVIRVLCALGFILGSTSARAQGVRDTSFKMEKNERVLQQSIIVNAGSKAVWQLISTTEGLRRFAAPRIEFELRPGGLWLSSFNKSAKLDDSGVHNKVLSYVPGRMLSTQIGFPKDFPVEVRGSETLFDVLMLEPVDAKHTRVVETMSGFGNGAQWDMTYAMFKECNAQTLEALVLTTKTGKPINWEGKNPYSEHHHPEGLPAISGTHQ
jgi:uncharacterized protein YndB with AHSA1/START domain